MNRHSRRASARRQGKSLAEMNRMAGNISAEQLAEARIAAQALRLSPEEARRALAEWAKRGGNPAKPQTFEFTTVHDPTKW